MWKSTNVEPIEVRAKWQLLEAEGWGDKENNDQRIQALSFKMNKVWRPNAQLGDYS